MAETLLIVIIAVIVADYLLERLLDYLDSRLYSSEMPQVLEGIYSYPEYSRSQSYLKAKQKFGFVTAALSLGMVLFMLISGGFGYAGQLVRSISNDPVLSGLLFLGGLFFISDLIMIPFSVYYVFVIEERYGFNRMKAVTFITDKIKSWLLAAVFGGGLLSLVIWIYGMTQEWFWLIAWGVFSLFTFFISMFYSQVIVPLFNKQKPLEAGALRDAIMEYCRKTNFRVDNVYVIDGSKRSKKANAYFTGLGPQKRIVLYDTLINDHSVEELVAILAHETGHYKKKHTLAGMLMSVVTSGLTLFVFSLFIDNPDLARALGAQGPSFHLNLLAFMLLFSPVSLVTGLIMNYVSRRNEYAADRYAAETYGAAALQSALKKLSVNHLSNLRPHPATVFFHYSHPPLLSRLGALEALKSMPEKSKKAMSPGI